MFKLKQLLLKTSQKEQGFTMVDVLIGILVSTAFLAVSMQSMVIATAFRVKAQEKQISNQLIQQDIEAVKSTANTFQQDPAEDNKFNVDSKCSATTYNDGYAKAVFDSLPAVPGNVKLLGTTGKEFTIERLEQPDDTAPNVLKVKYRVFPSAYTTEADKEANAVAKDYIEVIPNVALRCP